MKRIIFAGINILVIVVVAPISAQTQINSALHNRARVAVVGAGKPNSSAPGRQERETRARRKSKGGQSDYRIYYNQGVRHALSGRYEEAIAAFKRAIALDPDEGDAYFNLGDAYSDVGRWAEAVEAYKQAIVRRPRDGEAYNNLGVAYFKSGSYGNAFDALTEAIRIHPKWAEPHYNLSNVFYKLERYDAATVSYREAVRLRPDYATTRSPLTARLQTPATSNTPGSSKTVIRATSPTSASVGPPARTNTGPARGKPLREAPVSAAAGDVKRKDAEAYYHLGITHGREKRYDEAVIAFRRAALIKPNYTDAYFGLGHAYSYLGRWKEAIEAYEQVLRVDPKDTEAYYKLGEAYVKLRAQAGAPAPPNGASGSATSEITRSDERTAIGEKVGETSTNSSAQSPAAPAALAKETSAVSATGSASPKTGDAVASPRVPSTLKDNTESRQIVSSEATAAADPISIYRVGAGDVLDVRLLNLPTNRSTLFTVTAGGLLEYPLLSEPLQVAGLTTDEIGARLAYELKRGAINEHPEVAVAVREYVSHTIIVSGLVSDPGTKVLRREAIPLYVVIADAQLRPEAGQVVIDSRATGQKTTVDLTNQAALRMLVYTSDIVTIEARPRQFFYIGGQVGSPGQKDFHRGMTLTQAILASGGELSRKGTVKIMRQNKDGLLTTASYSLKDILSGRSPDPILEPDDRIGVEP